MLDLGVSFVSSPNVDGDLVKITFFKVGDAAKKFITWCSCQGRFGRFHNPVKLQGVVRAPLPTFIGNSFIPIGGWCDWKQEFRFLSFFLSCCNTQFRGLSNVL